MDTYKLHFIAADGQTHSVDALLGESVMQCATQNDIPGIIGECGGACACATCHCYVDPEWQARAGAPQDDEAALLEVTNDVRPNSRLSCQIRMRAELDGLVVRIPDFQF